LKPDLLKEKVRTVVFMALITFVAITLLSWVDIITKPAVERNKTLFLKQAVNEASGMVRPATKEALAAWYDARVTEVRRTDGGHDHFWVEDDGGVSNPVLIQKGPGLWGSITAFVGFDRHAGTIRGVTFQDHVETPGLGARIDESWFRRQFVGKTGPFAVLRPEPKDKNATTTDNDKFDQITGATITSTAVKDIMNKGIERSRTLTATR